jgi:hypothetical protein
MWRSSLENPPRSRSIRLVGESAAGVVAGFILVGPAEGDPQATIGELYAINVDPDDWGSGLGAALIDRGLAALSHFGFTQAVLWVHPANERARRSTPHTVGSMTRLNASGQSSESRYPRSDTHSTSPTPESPHRRPGLCPPHPSRNAALSSSSRRD